MADLTLNEKRLLVALAPLGEAGTGALAGALGTTEAAVVQYAHLCADSGLAEVVRTTTTTYALTPEGEDYRKNGLPERQMLENVGDSAPMRDLQAHPLSRIGIGWLRKKGWITIRAGVAERVGEVPPGDDEIALQDPKEGMPGIADLLKRNLITASEETAWQIRITAAGRALVDAGLDLTEETGTLTREQIISGSWRTANLRRYSLATPPKRIWPGKTHPYGGVLDDVRRILLEMGFEEMRGEIVQSAFWDFDALFQPQDHPAREMQDTFYLDLAEPCPPGWEGVRDIHEHGGDTSSTGWGGRWDPAKAEQCVLRTHTTPLSIRHLVATRRPPVKAFALGRVYRREAIDPTHLPEFEQLEGIVMDEDVTFRDLLGYLKEFYAAMGFDAVRFRPGYFPYTEPSVEPEVRVDGLGWVELGGAGVFREEVTAPWGIEAPVLAWGLGISRLAMLRLGLRDLRQLYRSDIDWIRDHPVIGREE
ncbi:phenylalanine--tRNA ligase subunit alpha [Methanofollis fontis]|uniref:Phenylalanine--tRNA ligase alpha subunit n=1 Tax=Methanofollis fontis TaxID=2052832 RepID=A0A483CVP6_9EURY|nr:phenylalanine--tRNA ligase subunit alpha [Methanofollis fontis]TAJ45190.1 phenylalanine--tRNA ligase subunit alpha [Methanofollis fontis]